MQVLWKNLRYLELSKNLKNNSFNRKEKNKFWLKMTQILIKKVNISQMKDILPLLYTWLFKK